MTDQSSTPKSDPETFVLRGKPRSVTRFKTSVLIGASAIACLVIAGVTWMGLKGPSRKPPESQVEVDKAPEANKVEPDRAQALPKTYSDIQSAVPVLGPPLPGDLGRPILEHQLAQTNESGQGSNLSMRPAPNLETVPMSGLFFKVGDTHPLTSEANAQVVSRNEATQTGQRGPDSTLSLDLDKDQNAQGRKLQFMGQTRSSSLNPHDLQKPLSPNEVMAGSVISASLVTGLNSDLPGLVIAQVSDNVYDSVTGKILLIPQGTRLIGSYDSVVAFGQSRALVVWQRLIRPDGSSLEIDNLSATDAQGYAGLKDSVDYHTWSLLKGVGLSTLLGIAGQAGSSSDSDLVKAIRAATAQTANQAGQKIVEKSLNIQPSLTVRPGWPLRVIVHKDLILSPYKF